ncbi:MAG: hypothetical protein ACRDKY_08595, partial [Solirubrobacteraceae bacterium]
VWTAPRDGEAIDVGAILRICPGLVHPPRGVAGVAELSVRLPDGSTRFYTLTAGRGAVTIVEREAPEADARVRGSERDWIDALGPGASRDGLSIEGDKRLAGVLLDGFAPAVADRAAEVA